MPEGPEIDTDKLREAIDEELDHEGGNLLRGIALSTALFAAMAAIASLEAGATVNEALALKTEATRLQAEASDQWAYYQAKGLKATIMDAEKNSWTVLDKTPPPELTAKAEHYAEDQKTSKDAAEKLEHERDEHGKQADELLHHHHFYAQSVALLQVSIALGAVAALTRRKLVWIGSAMLGIVGCGVFAWAFFGG
jgi:hypothetical protein